MKKRWLLAIVIGVALLIIFVSISFYVTAYTLQTVLEKNAEMFFERHGQLMGQLQDVANDCTRVSTIEELDQIHQRFVEFRDDVNSESNLFGILRFQSDKINDPNLREEIREEFDSYFPIEQELMQCIKEKEITLGKDFVPK